MCGAGVQIWGISIVEAGCVVLGYRYGGYPLLRLVVRCVMVDVCAGVQIRGMSSKGQTDGCPTVLTISPLHALFVHL